MTPGGDVAALVGTARATDEQPAVDSIVVVIAPIADPLDDARTRAAIAPLAIRHAPGVRINAVACGEGATPADVDSAVAFLEGARSTTGQILRVD